MFSNGRAYSERSATKQNQASMSNLTKNIIKNNKMNLRQEKNEDNDEQLPILSTSTDPRTSRYAKYQDEAVTSKTPPSSGDESSEADEVMKKCYHQVSQS